MRSGRVLKRQDALHASDQHCPTLTHAGARASPLKSWLLCCSLKSCAGEDSLQKSQCKLLIFKKRFLPGRNEITVSLLSFFLKLSCLLLNTFRIKDAVKMKWRTAVHKALKLLLAKLSKGHGIFYPIHSVSPNEKSDKLLVCSSAIPNELAK